MVRKNVPGTASWDEEQRLVLHLIWSTSTQSSAVRAAIFNHLFHDHLVSSGKPQGHRPETLRAQYAATERRKPCWQGICDPPSNPEAQLRRERWLRRIEEAERAVIENPQVSTANIRSALAAGGRLPAAGSTRLQAATAVVPSTSTPVTGEKRSHARALVIREFASDRRWMRSARVETSSASAAEEAIPSSSRLDISLSMNDSAMPPTPPRTPRSAKKLKLKPHVLRRQYGPDLNLTDEQWDKIHEELAPVSAARAHPQLPALLFRFWSSKSQGINCKDGFLAKKFVQSNIPERPPPQCTMLDWDELLLHLDRGDIYSPFISTSSSLVWVMRLAMQFEASGLGAGSISVINTAALDQRGVYYVPPYYRELAPKTFGFTNGAWRYSGTYEFLVWRKIQKDALVHTFKTADLMRACHALKLNHVVHLDTLVLPNMSQKRLSSTLASKGVMLTVPNCDSMANFFLLLGMNPTATPEQISHLVSEFVQGWEIGLPANADWSDLAAAFAHAFVRQSRVPVTFLQQANLKAGFLDGIRWACGGRKPRSLPQRVAKVQRHSRRLGLTSSARLVSDELDACKVHVWNFERSEQWRLQSNKRQALLNNTVEDDEDEDGDQDVIGDEWVSRFEMGDDGMVL